MIAMWLGHAVLRYCPVHGSYYRSRPSGQTQPPHSYTCSAIVVGIQKQLTHPHSIDSAELNKTYSIKGVLTINVNYYNNRIIRMK